MKTIKSYSNISRFKSIFAKDQFLNYLKTNFVFISAFLFDQLKHV